jgi:tetratricopeptide (TPR) repeat protein
MANELAGRGNEALQRAIAALNNQRPHDAERIAGEILKADPRHGQALHIFGYALLMQGRADDAIAALEQAARAHHDPAIDTQLALALRQVGRHEDALARLKRAVKRRPPFAPAFLEFGNLLSFLKRYDEAIEVFKRGLDVAPMVPELSIALGQVFLQRRDCPSARIAFAQALKISPDAPGALFGMAKAHQEVGENEAAVAYFRRYLMAAPHDAGAWLGLGHSLLELGQRDAGYDCFRTAARGDPKRYAGALSMLVKSGRGRFWLKPSDAARFLRAPKS